MKLVPSPHESIPQDVIDEINAAIERAASELFVNIQKHQHLGATEGENWRSVMRVFEYHARKGLRHPEMLVFEENQ